MPTLEELKTEYTAHETEGKDFYNSFRSQLVLDAINGDKTLGEALEIQTKFYKVACNLLTGDWKSASSACSEVLPNWAVPQSMIDQMQTDINNYITNNYSW